MQPTLSNTPLSHFLAIAIVTVAGCASQIHPRKPSPHAFSDLPVEHQQIYEALFQHMFTDWQQNRFHIPEHFFLQVGGFDAPDDLLARLAAQGYHVAPAFRYRHGRGILCSAEAIHFFSPSRVSVRGGYSYGNVGGSWGPFYLVKRHNKWSVVSREVDELARLNQCHLLVPKLG